MITLEQLLELVKEVEVADPIDWSDLAIDEDDANKLIAMNVLELYETDWSRLTQEERDATLLATVTKLLVENFALNIKNLQK
jgi:hypothetical protein